LNKSKILQIASVTITLIGVGYMGFSDARGIENNYAVWIIGFGVALSMFTLLFRKDVAIITKKKK